MSKSWFEKKMEDPDFKKGFEEETRKLSVAEQLVKLRLEAGLSQAEVARRIGSSASAICRYENAEYDRYELRTIERFVKACGGTLEIGIKRPASPKEDLPKIDAA